MSYINELKAKWDAFLNKLRPAFEGAVSVWEKIWDVLCRSVRGLFMRRKVIMALPVCYLLLKLREYCSENLPAQVGLILQESGEFSMLMPRDTVLDGCTLLTAGCLLMMFLSRKTLYPWLISLFSLALPLVFLLVNSFPV